MSVGFGIRSQRLEDGELAGKTAEECGIGQNWEISDSEGWYGTYHLVTPGLSTILRP